MFLGHFGVGKTSLIQSFKRESSFWSKDRIIPLNIETTAGITTHSDNILFVKDSVEYQVWDFAGHLEYQTIHQHFLSQSNSIYVIVVSMTEERKPVTQVEYWIEFLKHFVKVEDCPIIVFGNKIDLLPENNRKQKLQEFQNAVNSLLPDCKVIVDSLLDTELHGVSQLKKIISQESNIILKKGVQELPVSFVNFLEMANERKELVWQEYTDDDFMLSYLHNIGEIVYSTKSKMVCAQPQILSQLMGMFICPDEHEHSLLYFVENLKRPRKSIMSKEEVMMKVEMFLKSKNNFEKFNFDSQALNNIIKLMEDLAFFIGVDHKKNNLMFMNEPVMFPSLRPIGKFRWNYRSYHHEILTLGRRIKKTDKKVILVNTFCDFQVDLINLFNDHTTQTPFIYSNGVVFFFEDKTEIIVLLADSKKHIDIVIRGKSPFDYWEKIEKEVLQAAKSNSNFTVFFLSPDELFLNTKTFPLCLDHISLELNDLSKYSFQTRKEIMEGKSGDVHHLPPYPWSYSQDLVINTSKSGNCDSPLKFLELVPPLDGNWKNNSHKIEFERVAKAFEYFVGGVHRNKSFQLEKVVLLQNIELEKKFEKMYASLANYDSKMVFATTPQEQKDNNETTWKQAILSNLSSSVQNVSGDENVNLVLGWHGGPKEAIAFKIAEENFRIGGGMDPGYFGKGSYHTQFTHYSDLYRESKEIRGMPEGEPVILSWILMGKVYPVTEKADSKDANTLLGKPCKPGYNSHFVLVKNCSDDPLQLNFQPCNPEMEKPEYDEIVIFDKDQILPRYLVYFKRLVNSYSCTLCWVDPKLENNATLKYKLENNGINVLQFADTKSLIDWLKENHTSATNQSINIKIVSNRFRIDDGGECAGIRLFQYLKNSDYLHIPFAIYCSNKNLVKDQNSILVIDKEKDLTNWIISNSGSK